MTLDGRAEIARGLGGYAATLASVGTGTLRLSDELKKRILSTFMTLMIVRESLIRNAEPRLAELTSGQLRRTT